jgi:hypothetical protein
LVHEGGFNIRRDQDGATYFERPDGRVIPGRGYRLEDMVDDFEQMAPAAPAENPSAEVRETAAVYWIRQRPGTWLNSTAMAN